jgi:glutathione peroxidase
MLYKITFVVLGTIFIMGLGSFISEKLTPQQGVQPVEGSFYDFKIKSLEGVEIDFAQYKGKYVLIVNTASKCGFTPQYGDLEKLHEQFGDKVAVLGFPANNFLWQEPGSNEQIATFCERNYGVKFQMFEKVSVKGKDQHPLYTWLSGKSGHAPTWNFCKYLIDKNGNVVGFYPSKEKTMDKEIIDIITR